MRSIPEHLSVTDEDLPDADGAVAPGWRLQRREWLMLVEYAVTRLSGEVIKRWPRGDGHPVLVIPGFLGGPNATALLRQNLEALGYDPHDWGLGYNLGYRSYVTDELPQLVRQLHRRTGKRVSIIGWSAGGVYAREVARAVPEHVRSVITLGSPFRGNHRASNAWRTWALFNRGEDAAELTTDAGRIAREQPLDVPTTCLFSKNDGIVAWECCTSLPAPRTENVEVHNSHCGYGHSLETLYVIADRLAQPEGHWRRNQQ